MPFTLSHPAAAAALQPLIRRGWLAIAPLTIGAMVPDFEYFWHLRPLARWSHSATGLFTFCLPVGVAVLVFWEFAGRAAMRDLVGLGTTQGPARGGANWWSAAAFGIVIGTFTHLAWDGATHDGQWGVAVFPALRSTAITLAGRHPPIPWFVVADHVSTLVGGAVVVGWLVVEGRRCGAFSVLARAGWRWGVLSALAAVALAVGLWNGFGHRANGGYWATELWLARVAVGGLLGLAVGVVVYSLVYRATCPAVRISRN